MKFTGLMCRKFLTLKKGKFMKKLTIIDTFGFFFRLYYAMSSLKSANGKPSGMISGFANFINHLKSEFESDYIIFALDSKGKTFRSQIDPNYKINRTPPPPALLEQLPVCIEMIEKMGLCAISREGYEADDIIASVVRKFANEDIFVNVVTHDKDLYQLINDGKCGIYSPSKKIIYDSQMCLEKYGVLPYQVRDFLAISGDSSDNIPGVKGIGDKGAKDLLKEFGSLDEIYANIDKIANPRKQKLLLESKENAFISQKLATLYNELEFDENLLEIAKFPQINPLLNITEILSEYSLNRLLASLGQDKIKKNDEFKAHLILDENELFSLLSQLTPTSKIAFDTETTGVERDAKIVGFSFCMDDENGYYVPLNHRYLGAPTQISMQSAKKAVEKIFASIVVGQNLKFDFNVVERNLGVVAPKDYIDTMILAWLDHPGEPVGMDALAKKFYNYNTIKFEEVVAKGQNFGDISVESAAKYASEDAWITMKFFKTLSQKLDRTLLELAMRVEFPFIQVLLNMENNGILIDTDKIKALISENNAVLRDLTASIYSLSGENFNINSPKQLGTVLFERLNLPFKKKTKSGYSTDESVLNGLLDLHPVIEKILQYREYFKLQSTYCEPLLSLAQNDENSRVHSSFLQTGTATGRLASKNPNLQNIPARSELGKKLRECFVSESGFSFVSLDYSQIELRLLAHFSEDPALVSAFMNDEDIHSRTALSIFGEASSDKRAIAKSINFGLIYGMGASKLANEISSSKAEAKAYIEKYFAAFPTILDFIENLRNEAKNNGYTTTLLGRKRYFDFANAKPMEFAMYERECVNTKFQGSAADIIKLAMVEIYPHLSQNARLILQIHDELVFEVRDEEALEFGKKAQNIMQNVVDLKIPLKTSLNIAKNLSDLK